MHKHTSGELTMILYLPQVIIIDLCLVININAYLKI
jgi:hypothetical protein